MNGRVIQRVTRGVRQWLRPPTVHLSQAGQDRWVSEEAFNGRKGGFFVDVGAFDGVRLSNSFLLEQRYGWRGICVEADADSFARLRTNRRAACVHACVDHSHGEVDFAKRGLLSGIVSVDTDNQIRGRHPITRVKTTRLDSVLDELGAPAQVDYLSVDVEGAEERVLGTFPFCRYRFNCMTVERPPATLRQRLASHDYVLVREIPALDCFYVHRSFLQQYRANLIAFYHHQRVGWRFG